MDAIRTEGITPLSGYKFAHAISLGSHCYAAEVFRRLGLRRYSSPFDWMFTTPAMVHACIESDFAQFLDRQYYKPFEWERKTVCKHSFYDTYWQANFTHYNPLTDDGHAYLERCVNRFRQVLASPVPKLFMFVVQIHPQARSEYVEHFNNLHDAITSRSVNSTVIGVTVAPSGKKPEMTKMAKRGPSTLYHYSSKSVLGGISFEKSIDDTRFDSFVTNLMAT